MAGSSRGPLIVGSGIAGLFVALRARELGLNPVLVTKSGLDESNTRYAQGGIAAAVGEDDAAAFHLRDTVEAGAGLVDLAAARRLTDEGPRRVADLVRYGVPFDTAEGRVALGREAAHSRARILHAGGDATGLQIEETLRARALREGIEARERTVLRALRVEGGGRLIATLARDDGSAVEEVDGRPVVLATGGAGSLFRQSSNPEIATGEGLAVAFRAGALVSDLEFVQFHPTAFYRPGAPRFLISEAVRGEGAVLRNVSGERFLRRYHRAAELAPRDIVSRAIWSELNRTGADHVELDATGFARDRFLARFPTIFRFLSGYGLDPAREPIPVTPVAHYTIGGVTTDLEGRTSLPGLFACGEVAATGVHGANRLASNSLLEGLVFGEHVVRSLLHPTPGGPRPPAKIRTVTRVPGAGRGDDPADIESVRDLLWERCGIVRSGPGLAAAVKHLERLRRGAEPAGPGELAGRSANGVLTALLIAQAAQVRTESRGAHFRSDHPRPRAAWRLHLGLRVAEPGAGDGPPE